MTTYCNRKTSHKNASTRPTKVTSFLMRRYCKRLNIGTQHVIFPVTSLRWSPSVNKTEYTQRERETDRHTQREIVDQANARKLITKEPLDMAIRCVCRDESISRLKTWHFCNANSKLHSFEKCWIIYLLIRILSYFFHSDEFIY